MNTFGNQVAKLSVKSIVLKAFLNIPILGSFFKLIIGLFTADAPLKSNEAEELLNDSEKKQELLSKLEQLKKGEAKSVEIEVNGQKLELTVNKSYQELHNSVLQ